MATYSTYTSHTLGFPSLWASVDFALHNYNLAAMAPAIIFNLPAGMLYPWLLHRYFCIYQPSYVSDNLNCVIIRWDSDAFILSDRWKHWAWQAYQCLLTQYAPLSAACGTNLKVKSAICRRTCHSFKYCVFMVSGKANSTVKLRPLSKDNRLGSTTWPTKRPLIAHHCVYVFCSPKCRG